MRSNQKNSGFLPEERGWLDRVIDELGYVDVFRELEPRPEQYTWWPNRGRAWEKNVGWRLDSELATLGIAARARGASVDLSMTQPRSEVTSRRSPVNAPSVVVTRRQSSAGRKLTELPEARPAMSPGIERRRVDPAHPRRTSLRRAQRAPPPAGRSRKHRGPSVHGREPGGTASERSAPR